MSKTSRKSSRFWIRFWIPLLVSYALTPVLFCLGVGPALIALGSHSGQHDPRGILLPILFPYTTLITVLIFSQGGPVHSDFIFVVAFYGLPLVQFPVYGIFLGFANAKRMLIPAGCILLVIHLLAIGFVFMYMRISGILVF